jgi:diketogulonate reductase-like aldo/keto reductase
MRAMRSLREQGLVRDIGVSNFSLATLHQAQEHLGFPVVLDQVHYNLVFREPEISGLIDYCQKNDIFVMAWRPLEKGVLAVDSPDIIKKFSDKYNRTPAQVIINWLISQDNVVTLSTMRNEKNLRENLGAIGWSLEAEDIEELGAAFPNQEKVSNREPLL